MNSVEIAWPMMAAACLTLGLLHLYVWHRLHQYDSLLFFVLAFSIATFSGFELAILNASTPEAYATAVRWAHVPITIVILSIIGFVHFNFRSGRPWLLYAACASRLLALALNFTTGVNLNFEKITALDHVRLWGGSVVAVPIGVNNPAWIVGQTANALLVAFIADASLTLWRRGDTASRRRGYVLGGAFILCVLFGWGVVVLLFTGHVRGPTVVTPAFFFVVLAIGHELGENVARAGQLSRDLRDSERRSELAARAAGLAFWSWSAVSKDFWISPFGRALFGFTELEPIDLDTFLSRIHPDDRTAVRLALEETAHSGAALEQEFRFLMSNSMTRWIAARGQMDTVAAGAPALLWGVAFDITARVQMERQVAQHRRELAHISRVSTMGTLAASIAHEINQPLMGILANAEAAQALVEQANIESPELCEILCDIVEADKRAGEVIRRLREMLRKGQVHHQPLNVNDVVNDVLRLMRNELLHRGVAASLRLAHDIPLLRGDRVQMQQVLINLCMNACDAMHGCTSPQLQICTRGSDAYPLEISVADCGSGIPAAELERVFEPFVTTKEHGMGLGLSVCRTIVAAHGGRLWAENNPSAGATFRLAFPTSSVAS